MRKIDKVSRRGVVNLFADFILTKFKKEDNSIIQVTDCGSFVVVHGMTTSNEILDLQLVKSEFSTWFDDILSQVGMLNFSTIDLIKYEQDVPNLEKGLVMVNKDVFVEEEEPFYDLGLSSEFPYGYSLNCGRLMTYYSHYIFNHMYSLLGVDQVNFYFTKEEDKNEDYKIIVSSNSRLDKNKIKSLILDVFDFDLKEFESKLDGYDLFQDIMFPDKNKPYLVQDKLEHIVLV